MACDANIIPIVLSGDGVVLDEGRRKRLATREQRLALRAMYDTCAIDGCSTPFDRCEIHHVDPFGPPTNGNTDLRGLVPLCSRHHHLVHDNNWQLHLSSNRNLTVTHPDGRTELHPFTPPGQIRSDDSGYSHGSGHIEHSEEHGQRAA